MPEILEKKQLAKDIKQIILEARDIASSHRPGQFVVIVAKENSERIPLTIADSDIKKGTITLIFQEVGFSTCELGLLEPGDTILHVLGPLGRPTEVKKFGTVVCVAGGVGVAEVLPVAKAMKAAGNRIISIIGARDKKLIILEDLMREYSDELFICTDNGSYGRKGKVSDTLNDILTAVERSTHTIYPNLVYAVGPIAMMEAVSKLTQAYNIKTVVSLNPIMVDATGMCGACRVTVAGEIKFGCVDGPEFDGHLVDFKELRNRLSSFKEKEEQCQTELKQGSKTPKKE